MVLFSFLYIIVSLNLYHGALKTSQFHKKHHYYIKHQEKGREKCGRRRDHFKMYLPPCTVSLCCKLPLLSEVRCQEPRSDITALEVISEETKSNKAAKAVKNQQLAKFSTVFCQKTDSCLHLNLQFRRPKLKAHWTFSSVAEGIMVLWK